MLDPSSVPPTPAEEPIQLAQVRVPLERAGMAFETPDASGRTPIVVLPQRNLRVRVDLVAAAAALAAVAVLALIFDWNPTLVPLGVLGAAALAVLASFSAFFVRVPEGTTALLVQAGRHRGLLGPGSHFVMPWLVVSHVVTRRQIPFELPTIEAPTRDNVSARIDALLTFTIAEPDRFVYAIAAPDFDLVMQAACQDAVRSILRQLSWSELLDIGAAHTDRLRAQVEVYVRTYGVAVHQVNITQARPEAAFLRSEEARQLAMAQRAEEAEQHALAERRLNNEHELARLRVLAGVERDRALLQSQIQQAEMRRRVAEIDAETHEFRLAHLEQRLARYPRAAEWEWQSEQLAVAQALAANSRAIVQLGRASDIVAALWPREPVEPDPAELDNHPAPNGPAWGGSGDG